jgi:hypothetical protein
VTLPAFIGRTAGGRGATGASPAPRADPVEKLRFFREQYPALFATDRDLQSLLFDAGADFAQQLQWYSSRNVNSPFLGRWVSLTPAALWRLPLRDKAELFAAALRDPRRSLAWLRMHAPTLVRVRRSVREAVDR